MATAPPSVYSETAPTESSAPMAHVLGMLRGIRAEVQHVRDLILAFGERARLSDAQARELEVTTFLSENQKILDRREQAVSDRVEELHRFLGFQDALAALLQDHAVHIRAHWERAGNAWSLAATKPYPLPQLDLALEQLDLLIYQCAIITLPDRINGHLRTLRVGQSLDFKTAFADELPREEDQNKILDYIRAHPRAISGVVDPNRAVIYQASPHPFRRVVSYLAIAAAALTGFVIAYLITQISVWLPAPNWPITPARLPELLVAYALLLAGGALHVGVDALKQLRAPASPLLALEDSLLWIHVKELPNIAGLVSFWIGLVGLAWAFPVIDGPTAFFVGYSIDSFVELFLARFDVAAGKQAGAARERLHPAG